MALQLTHGSFSLVNGVLTHVESQMAATNVVKAYCVDSPSNYSQVVYRFADGSVGAIISNADGSASRQGVVTANYESAAATGVELVDSGTAIPYAVLTSEVPIDMSGNKIINGSEAVNDDGFVILSQLRNAIADLQSIVEEGDQTNADAIATLTEIVNNLDLDSGLNEDQVTAIADARVAAGLLTQFDNETIQSLVDQLRSQLSSVDTAILDNVTALIAQLAALELRVTAIETDNEDQAERMTAIEGVNSAQNAAIASLQAGLAAEVQVNSAQAIQLQGHQAAITNLNAVTTPIVVELRNGIVFSASGVPVNAVSIDSSNTTHMLVTIDANGRRNCEMTFLRVLNGVGKKALCDEYCTGVNQDKYVFGIKKLVGGTSDATFRLSGGSFF